MYFFLFLKTKKYRGIVESELYVSECNHLEHFFILVHKYIFYFYTLLYFVLQCPTQHITSSYYSNNNNNNYKSCLITCNPTTNLILTTTPW